MLVAYDVPFRDCGQYSAGGTLNTADYLAWIDGFARGIGSSRAVVLLEPDGLGIIPYNTDINGNADVPARPVRHRSDAGGGQSGRATTRSVAQSRDSSSSRT